MPFRNKKKMLIISFFKNPDSDFESISVFLFNSFWLILADPDPGSKTVADPTDPDPKHWFCLTYL